MEKYSKNINQKDNIFWGHENNCRAHLQTKFATLIIRYPTSKGIKNVISWKPFFRRNSTFLSKLDLSDAITWQLFKFLNIYVSKKLFFAEKKSYVFKMFFWKGVQIFSINREGLVKYAERGGDPITYFRTNQPFLILSFSEWVVVCVLLIYTISLTILCVSWEEFSLIESNQQIYDFYKSVIFEKQRHFGTLQSKSLISANYWT